MQSPWLTRPAIGLLAAAFSSCLAFQYEEQEVHVRHDVETDRLEIAIVYTGVYGPASEYTYERRADDLGAVAESDADRGDSASGLEGAARFVADVGAGRRYFLFYDWPFVIDLDSTRFQDPVEVAREETLRQALVAFGKGIRVDRSALFVDGEGELGIVQHWVVPELSSGLGVVNDLINSALLEHRAAFLSSSAEEGEVTFGDLSSATRLRWLERAEAGEAWIAATRGGFEVSLPLSSAEFARALGSIVGEVSSGGAADLLVPLALALSEITHQDGILTARLLPSETGWLSFVFERAEAEADEGLLDLLQEREAPIQVLSRDQARALARGD